MIRASFGIYNTCQEVDEFLNNLDFIISRCRKFENNII